MYLLGRLGVWQSTVVVPGICCLETVPESAWIPECGLGMLPPVHVSIVRIIYMHMCVCFV